MRLRRCIFLPAATNGFGDIFRPDMGDLKVTPSKQFCQHGSAGGGSRSAGISMKLGIVALPVAYLIGWLAMLAAETPLLFRRKE